MNEERRILNSSSYPTNADKHKAVVETWNNYSNKKYLYKMKSFCKVVIL